MCVCSGDPELSLMESVEFHELLHVVRVDAPEPEYGGRDDGPPRLPHHQPGQL